MLQAQEQEKEEFSLDQRQDQKLSFLLLASFLKALYSQVFLLHLCHLSFELLLSDRKKVTSWKQGKELGLVQQMMECF